MADDLVDRLRDAGYVLVSPGMRKLAHEAAARIEALEAALAEARRQALEEAAKACDVVLGGALEALSGVQEGSIAAVAVRGNVAAARYCTQAIRALASDALLDRQGKERV